jgi:hypothetical protein
MPTMTSFNSATFAAMTQAEQDQYLLGLWDSGSTYAAITVLVGLPNNQAAYHAVQRAARRAGRSAESMRRREYRPMRRNAVAAAPSSGRLAGLLNRRFGVELEHSNGLSDSARANALRAAGLAASTPGYTHAVTADWKVIYDGSTGGEVVSPVLRGEDGFAQVRTAMQVLKSLRAGAGRSASVHVHFDVNDLDRVALGRLAESLENVQAALMAYVADSRLGNTYAPALSASQWATIRRNIESGRIAPRAGSRSDRDYGSGVSRYGAFNFNSVLVYGTVEFRLHGATFNPAKIKPWIAVGMALVEYAKQGGVFSAPTSVSAMLDALVSAGVLSRRLAANYRAGVAQREASGAPRRRHYIPEALAA